MDTHLPLRLPILKHRPLAVQQADWDGDRCGPGCEEHRREVREQERARWEQHRRWEDHQRREENRYPTDGYQHR
jgi:hypothetical protein